MNKKVLSFIFVVMCTFIFMSGVVKADELKVEGLYGSDRYETCCKIADQGWKSSDYAVIVNGALIRNDNLCATVLAKKYNAPILLSSESGIDSRVESELKKLKVKKVFIIGSSVSSSIESQLHNINITAKRINGMDMFQNSVEIANEIGTSNGVILVNCAATDDIGTLAPIAAKLQMPVLLMGSDYASSQVEKFISGKNVPVAYVVGEKDLFSDAVISKFSNVKRIELSSINGNHQMDILKAFSDKVNFDNIFYVYEHNFLDILSSSALAALNGNPVVLEYPKSEHNFDCVNLICSKNVKKVNIIGLNDDLTDISSESKALSIIKSKVKNDGDYGISNIKYIEVNEGIYYYSIELYDKENQSLKYNFLVNTNTKSAYKIEAKTNKIVPLDNM
ncbi:cell wall-binding repeat-containing protein [Clostridium sp. P21]|uniref:Cell wall-binding repeat-containing protein n=1 Tax=Clostridium muellerianum TaxID=2716538 RepID=A0A7Y0EEZ0_9CLOT|nr:cell wall-binding repeat-containing protein [Clostridium muellerianum]NMM62138.1 cell wall-binding repeat-containing protein [Clostridium muellerianum]